MEPLLNQGAMSVPRVTANFAQGGDVGEGEIHSRPSEGELGIDNQATSEGAGDDVLAMADGGVPNPAHDRRIMHPAGQARPVAPAPASAATPGAAPADNGFFHTLAQHFANSPMGKLIMGANKPATSSGTPLSPGEKPSQGAPLNSVPAETPAETPDVKPAEPISDAGQEATRQTGSPVEGAAINASDADSKMASGGDVWDDNMRPVDRQYAKGGQLDMQPGGPVPGEAEVPGNSLENDKVPAMLSPGEVVLPRTVAHKPHQAKRFVQHLKSNGGDGAKTLASIKKRKAG
jgi:hypothetical protein